MTVVGLVAVVVMLLVVGISGCEDVGQGCHCPPNPPILSSQKKWEDVWEDKMGGLGGQNGRTFRRTIKTYFRLI